MPRLLCWSVLFLSPWVHAETVDVVPPLVEGRAVYAGPEYIPMGSRTLIVDKVCEALGFKSAQAYETKFAVVSGGQEFALVGEREDDESLTFYFIKVGRADRRETVGYLSQLTCIK